MFTVWLVDLTYTQQSISSDSMPYGVGCLAAYAGGILSDVKFRVFKYPESLISAFDTEDNPQIVGFSHYMWNSQLSLSLARIVHAKRPAIVTIFGGPHYSTIDEEQIGFLRANPQIDFYISGEAEVAFTSLIRALYENDFRRAQLHGKIPSVHSVDSSGRPYLPVSESRLNSLEAIPSPYRLGLMDQFFDGCLVPMLQTNRGCPFTCTFCIEGGNYYRRIAARPRNLVYDDLHYIGKKMGHVVEKGGRNELILTDSNFGMYYEDKETSRVIAECQDMYNWPRYVYATTGKNQRYRVLSAIRHARGAIQLTGSVQSTDAQVLSNVRRKNINTESLVEQALEARAMGSDSYSDIILGLPGDTQEAHFASVSHLLDSGFGSLTLFQLSLLPGSELATPLDRARFSMTTRFRVLPRCFGHYRLLGEEVCAAEIDEICVGLENLSFEEYIDCRVYDFLVMLLHNHSPFSVLEKFLRSKGLRISDWIKTAKSIPLASNLSKTFDYFIAEARDQLFENREALLSHISRPQIIDRYIAGEFGNNEMYTYRAHAYVHALSGLISLAFDSAILLLQMSAVPLAAKETRFLDDLRRYIFASCDGMFDLSASDRLVISVEYDLDRYIHDTEADVPACHYRKTHNVALVRSARQREALLGYSKTVGENVGDIGRILAKTRLYDFVRTIQPS